MRRTVGGKRLNVHIPHLLVHSPKDNVGVVVVEGLKAGTDMLGVVTEPTSPFDADGHGTTFRSATRSR